MKITRREVSRNWMYVILSLVVGFLIILMIVIYNGNNHVDQSIQYYTDFIVEDSKVKVKVMNEVNNRLDEIYYDMSIIEDDARDDLVWKVISLETVLDNQDIADMTKIAGQEDFLDVFEKLTCTDQKHQYFVMQPDDGTLVFGNDNFANDIEPYYMKDENGTYYIREMIKAVNTPDGVFVEYLCPGKENEPTARKTSYCRYLEEYDVIIGASFCYEDIMIDLQEKTFQRLLSYYKDENSYIFLTTYEGIAVVSQIEDRIGKKYFTDQTSPEWELHQDIMAITETGEGGFVTYEYYDRDTNEKQAKVSYVCGIDEWEMYIGMVVYTEQLAEMTEQYAEEFSNNQMHEILYTSVILLLVAFFIYFFIRRGIHLFRGYMEQEEGIYKELFSISYEAIFVISKKGRVLHKNQACVSLFGNHLEEYIINGKLILEKAEDDCYVYKSESGKKYLSYREEIFRFNLEDAVIYFVQDVTDTILKSQETELLAMKDALTGAFNRRALIHDIDVLKNQNKKISLTIAIIDLDYFKKVNDTYGHSMGDEILKLLTNKFHTRLRSVDRFYRYGGEEFIVSFQNIELLDAKRILEEINISFSEEVKKMLGKKTTFSAGVVKELVEGTTDLDILVQEADKLLYQAKERGRNQVNIGE